MGDEEKEKLLDDFLGDRKETIEEDQDKPDEDGKELGDEHDKKETPDSNPYDKDLGLFEYIFTDAGNVIMSKETYVRLMSKFM